MGAPAKLKVGAGLVLLAAVVAYLLSDTDDSPERYVFASPANPIGLKPTSCWFESEAGWPEAKCFNMQVAEDHADISGRLISFPLVIFKAAPSNTRKNPVLHLGAGGPGGAMHLDSQQSMREILETYAAASLDIGRDLMLIDPRGSGLARPLLTCDLYVAHEVERLATHLTLLNNLEAGHRDYIECIDRLHRQGVNFNHYNSMAIVRDIEALRRATGVNQWALLGVSYAAVYAQFLARHFAETVEVLVLDSPAFPAIKAHHNYIARVLAPYEMLFQNCGDEDGCNHDKELERLQANFWNLHQYLNSRPLRMMIMHPFTDNRIPVVLNGERFLSAVAEGVYGTKIFTQLKQILADLSVGDTRSIYPYFKSYLGYLLDTTYGDISAEAHFCFEGKPFIDYDLIRSLIGDLPAGYIRDTARLSIDWPDHCAQMQIVAGSPELAEAVVIDTPTLFLQGTLDAVTPMSDIEDQKSYFHRSELVTFVLSHDVLASSPCAAAMAAYFIEHKTISGDVSLCN